MTSRDRWGVLEAMRVFVSLAANDSTILNARSVFFAVVCMNDSPVYAHNCRRFNVGGAEPSHIAQKSQAIITVLSLNGVNVYGF